MKREKSVAKEVVCRFCDAKACFGCRMNKYPKPPENGALMQESFLLVPVVV